MAADYRVRNKGAFGTGSGLARDKLPLPFAFSAANLMGTLRVWKKKIPRKGDLSGQATRRTLWLLCFEGFYLLSTGGDFRGCLRGELNRIFVSFSKCLFRFMVPTVWSVPGQGVQIT